MALGAATLALQNGPQGKIKMKNPRLLLNGIIVALFFAVLSSWVSLQIFGSARAQTPSIGNPLVALGYCQLPAIAAATPLSSCPGGIPVGATTMVLQVSTTSARYRDDGTNPTATVGFPVATGVTIQYMSTLSKFVIIPTAATSTIDILFYR